MGQSWQNFDCVNTLRDLHVLMHCSSDNHHPHLTPVAALALSCMLKLTGSIVSSWVENVQDRTTTLQTHIRWSSITPDTILQDLFTFWMLVFIHECISIGFLTIMSNSIMCFMILYDALWCFMMLNDGLCCFMTLYDAIHLLRFWSLTHWLMDGQH